MDGGFEARPLDASPVRSVERVVFPGAHEVGLGAGIYPFDPFFFGFTASADYTYWFSGDWAWEILHGTYVFSVDKNLTIDLADNYQVNPQEIIRLQYLADTNLQYAFAYGKSIFGGTVIRYFRASALGGFGVLRVSDLTRPAAAMGVKIDLYVTRTVSMRVEVRNSTALSGGFSSYPRFELGVGIAL